MSFFPLSSLGWDKWLPALLELVGYDARTRELIFFVGDPDYQAELAKRGFETCLEEERSLVSQLR